MRQNLFLILIGLLGAAILCGLGVWQVQRLNWKQQVLAEIDARIGADPVAVPVAPSQAQDKYLPVEATGEIQDGEILVYVSVKHVGPGYRVIAPFLVDDRRIMIDRGFLPVDKRNADRDLGVYDVVGNLHWPDEKDGFTPDPDLAQGIWFARDVPAMASTLGTEPVLLVAATRTSSSITPLPVDTTGIPNDHLQYAITWFLLALVWIVMSVHFFRRNRFQQRMDSLGRNR